ncbi:Frataxin [Peniophora sp. CONT]|nr:Frataxin [Peniophora sp. CONT]
MFSRPIARCALRQPSLRVAGLCTAPLCIHAARKLATSSSAHARAQILSTRRHYATPPPQVVLSDLSEDDYHYIADQTLDRMLESLEELIDTRGDPSFEVDYSSGVLTLDLGTHGKYVINKQPPNKQIWLSSPVSGPKRYDLSRETGDWVYARDKHTLGVLLNEELSVAFGEDIDLGLGAEVQRSVTQRFGVELPDVKA